jgi:lysyl-tRNA synthetase class 2
MTSATPTRVRATRRRRRSAPWLIAAATTAVGLVGLSSAAAGDLPGRLGALEQALTIDTTTSNVLRGLVVAGSIGLLLFARGLARHQRRAWQATTALLVAMTVLFALRAPEEVGITVAPLLLVALVWWRRQFYGISDLTHVRGVAAFAATASAVLYAYGVIAIFSRSVVIDRQITFGRALYQVSWGLLGQDVQIPETRFSAALTITLSSAALGTVAIIVAAILSSPRSGVSSDERDRADARRLVTSSGGDTLSYFALRRDKRYFFNDQRTAFLAYRAIGGIALVSGDPIGEGAAVQPLLAAFADHCRANSWRIAAIGVGAGMIAAWETLGLKAIAVGEEAIVRPPQFSLEGRRVRKLRQSVNRLERLGYGFEIVTAADLDARRWEEIERISLAWKGGRPERGFSMALSDMHWAECGDTLFALAIDPTGEATGFLHFVPVPASGDLSLSAMRRLPDTPNGLTEFLVCRAIDWARERGVERMSLNFAAFGGLLRADADTGGASARLAGHALRSADRFFQIERLLEFNRKFLPEWQPRYLAVQQYTDIPAAGLVLLSLEGLVQWPGRLQRLVAGLRRR